MNDLENALVLGHDDPPDWTPDAVLCACGKAGILAGYDGCLSCETAFYLAHADDFDDNFRAPPTHGPSRLIYRAVVDERLRRFAAGEAVYPQIRRVG